MKIAKVLPRRSRRDFINRMWGGTPTFDFSFDWHRGASHVCACDRPVTESSPIGIPDLGFLLQWSAVQRRIADVREAVNHPRKGVMLPTTWRPEWPL